MNTRKTSKKPAGGVSSAEEVWRRAGTEGALAILFLALPVILWLGEVWVRLWMTLMRKMMMMMEYDPKP